MRIVNPLGAQLPRGEVGKIAVLSRAVMRVCRPHDEEGFLSCVDQVTDIIVGGGDIVHSAEVEQAVAKPPALAACAVIRVADVAATAYDIRNHCKRLIGGYKCQRSVAPCAPALPVSGAGKVLKTRLAEPFRARQLRQVV